MARLANIIVAFVPVLVFLAVLVVMDSFKLARPSAIATALGWGVVAAVLSSVAQLSMTGALSDTAFHRGGGQRRVHRVSDSQAPHRFSS
jgi:hypothetical protein